MDKETFSSYGWIVITVLVLAVMIAFAGPFGELIKAAVNDLVGDFTNWADEAVSNYTPTYPSV